MKIVFLLIIIILQMSCNPWHEEKVIITRDYFINPNWDESNNYNSIDIYRMILKDSSEIIDLESTSQVDLVSKLKKDTSFQYGTNVVYNGENFDTRKIYFNRDNGFSWTKWGVLDSGHVILPGSGTNVLGRLERNTWYVIAGLSIFKSEYYIYIDSSDIIHRYRVEPNNW